MAKNQPETNVERLHPLAARPELTPERVDRIVVGNTPNAPRGAVDPDTQLLTLGVVSDELSEDLQAGVQNDLNRLGWHIRQDDITATPATTVSRCRTSVIKRAF
jgi:hypothetical protein